MIAIKRFVDAEAVVLDTYEQMENTNGKVLNELGKMKRSSHKAGKVGKNTLGGFVAVPLDVFQGLCEMNQWTRPRGVREMLGGPNSFNIGTGVGLTEKYRKELWERRKSLVGKIIKYRYQAHGTIDKPRLDIFLGFRDRKDL